MKQTGYLVNQVNLRLNKISTNKILYEWSRAMSMVKYESPMENMKMTKKKTQVKQLYSSNRF